MPPKTVYSGILWSHAHRQTQDMLEWTQEVLVEYMNESTNILSDQFHYFKPVLVWMKDMY
jgi:hypothetical protein